MRTLPLVAFAVFPGVAAWMFFARRGQDYDALARLPLAEQGAVTSDSRGARIHRELE
jgi:cytochrome c oxidase cbb3-type subunit IV